MKKIILFSSLLMISALLYGAIDFFISDNSGKLKGLYEPAVQSTNEKSVVSKDVKVVSSNATSKIIQQAEKNTSGNKKHVDRTVSLEKFSRAALVEIPEEDSLAIIADSTKQIERAERIRATIVSTKK